MALLCQLLGKPMRKCGKNNITFFYDLFLIRTGHIALAKVCRVNFAERLPGKANGADGGKLRLGMR